MIDQAGADARTGRGRFWIGVVAGIFVMQMTVGAVLLYFAHSDPSFAVEENYYEKALHWDDDAALRRASEALGWSFDLNVGKATGVLREQPVTVRLADAQGAPIAGATVSMVAYHNARADDAIEITLAEEEPGVYAGSLRARLSGVWVFRVRAEKDDDLFVLEVRRDVTVNTGATS